MQRLGPAALTLVALFSTVGQAAACTGEQPTFAEAVANADAITRVVVEDVTEFGEPPAGETFAVVRVLKGDLPDKVQLDDPRTGLCGDTIGYYAPVGTEVIVAFGVPFYGTLVNPVWIETDHPVEPLTGLGAPAPDGVASLDDLERLIVATLPNTSVEADARPVAALTAGMLLIVAALAILLRRLRRS